jgi:hypothetical protein
MFELRRRGNLLICLGVALILLPEPITTAFGSILILCVLLAQKRSTLVNSSGVIVRNGCLPRRGAYVSKAGRL